MQMNSSRRWKFYFVQALTLVRVPLNLVSIGVYTIRFWPALRAELRLPDD
jgi:hypothetical protein